MDRITFLISLPTIPQILESFAVGTEQRKMSIPLPPNDQNELIALQSINQNILQVSLKKNESEIIQKEIKNK